MKKFSDLIFGLMFIFSYVQAMEFIPNDPETKANNKKGVLALLKHVAGDSSLLALKVLCHTIKNIPPNFFRPDDGKALYHFFVAEMRDIRENQPAQGVMPFFWMPASAGMTKKSPKKT